MKCGIQFGKNLPLTTEVSSTMHKSVETGWLYAMCIQYGCLQDNMEMNERSCTVLCETLKTHLIDRMPPREVTGWALRKAGAE